MRNINLIRLSNIDCGFVIFDRPSNNLTFYDFSILPGNHRYSVIKKLSTLNYLRLSLLLLALAIWPSSQSNAQGFDVLKPTGKWITDRGDMLNASEERRLSEKLDAYEDTTSTQIVIVTLPGLNGIPPADYAIELGRQWQVGQQGQNNGVVILASRNDRKIFIATGYGLEGAIPDAIANRIIQNIMVPNFRQGHFYNGFTGAVDALVDAARGEFQAGSESGQDKPIDTETILFFIFLALFLFAFLSKGGGNSGGKHYRNRRRNSLPVILWGPSFGGHGRGGFGGFGGGFGGGGGGFGGFGGGGGSFGGGGAGGGW